MFLISCVKAFETITNEEYCHSFSSEDEIDVILHGTPEQRRKLQHMHKKWIAQGEGKNDQGEASSSSEDEFEKEMEAELNLQVEFLEKSRGWSYFMMTSLIS